MQPNIDHVVCDSLRKLQLCNLPHPADCIGVYTKRTIAATQMNQGGNMNVNT